VEHLLHRVFLIVTVFRSFYFCILWNLSCILLQDLCSVSVEDATQLGLVEHQGLISQVVKVGGRHEHICVTTKLSGCWDYSTEVNTCNKSIVFSDSCGLSSSTNSQRSKLCSDMYSVIYFLPLCLDQLWGPPSLYLLQRLRSFTSSLPYVLLVYVTTFIQY
jgi:hypothetical protein